MFLLAAAIFFSLFRKILFLNGLRVDGGHDARKILSRLDLHVKYCQITTYDPAGKFRPRLSAGDRIGQLGCGRQGQMSHG